MPTLVARRAFAALLLLPALACRPKGTVTTNADGSTTVASGGNVVETRADGSVRVRSADGASIDVAGEDVRPVGAQAGAQAGAVAALGTSAVAVDNRGVAHAVHGVIAVSEDETHQTIDCGSGGSVSVSGNDNVLALTGTCARVTVVGNDNTLTIAAVGAIDAAGNDNHVAYAAGVGGKDPTVTNAGTDNTVARGGR